MKNRFLLAAFFYTGSLLASLDEAEACFNAALYKKSAQLYSALLKQNPKEEWERQFAKCLFYLGEYQDLALFLEKISYSAGWKSYLLAAACSRLGNYERAIEILSGAEAPDDEMRFEEALARYFFGQPSRAKSIFEQLAEKNPAATLYLARIELENDALEEAKQLLNDLVIDQNSSIRFEKAYLLGEIFYHEKNFPSAAAYFSDALPSLHVPWAKETLSHLGWSYLKLAESTQKPEFFADAKRTFQQLLALSDDESGHLALGQLFLIQAKVLHDEEAFENAEKILSDPHAFTSREAKCEALLLRAQAAPTHAKRDALYRQATNEAFKAAPLYGRAWFLRGLNDFEEAKKIPREDAGALLERAAFSFQKAAPLLQPAETALSMQLTAESYMADESARGFEQAFSVLQQLLQSESAALLPDPSRAHYLHALAATRLSEFKNEQNWDAPIALIQDGLAKYPGKDAQYLLGLLLYKSGNFAKSEEILSALQTPEALFWSAKARDARGLNGKEYRVRLYTEFPTSPLAAEAYFTTYSYQDYLQGLPAAVKHLDAMEARFADSPFLLNAYYLIGLDYKRNRKTPEGKWVRKRDLNASINFFHLVETTFDQEKIPESQKEHYTRLRYYATLERALCNLAIADESEGAKRQIFLEYAEEVLRQIVLEFSDPAHPLAARLCHKEPYPQIEEESTFWLATTYLKAGEPESAQKVLEQMNARYSRAMITRGYFLSRMWTELGQIALSKQEYAAALSHLQNAEESAKGKVLSIDEKLGLWIAKSQCYCGMKDYDNAILILTGVTNEDAVSSLRLKAMFLRAEMYEKQNRPELARNQLKALAKKGGEWAQKAKQTLEDHYGY